VDNDCNADTPTLDMLTWYEDVDGDGYGNPENTIETCTPPNGFVLDGTDCDDSNEWTYPGADEICDGVDNDCNADTPADGSCV